MEILTESRLSNELGVSRTPIREALSALEQEHFVESQGKGVIVLGITLKDVVQIFEVRKRIEGLAAAECAANITEEGIARLQEILDLQEFYLMKNDSEKAQAYDSQFHERIYYYSGSVTYYDTLLPLHKKVQKYRQSSLEYHERGMESLQEHKRILEALKERNREKAEEEMLTHVINAEKNIMQLSKEVEL